MASATDKKLVLFHTKEMAASRGDTQTVMQITVREMTLYALFIMVLTIMASAVVNPMMYCLTTVLKGVFIDRKFATTAKAIIAFNDIKTAEDFWAYTETILKNGFFWEQWYGTNQSTDTDNRILYNNQILGVPRLRQLRVRNDSCDVHEYFRRTFATCYDTFSREAEDTASFGPGGGTAWEFSTATKTGSIDFIGKVASYHGGGYYQDLNLESINTTKKKLARLKRNRWLNLGTRCIFVDFSVYNANLNLFSVIKLVFELPPSGGIIASYSFQTFQLIRYTRIWDYFIMACEITCLGFVIFYTVEKAIEIKQIGYCCLITAVIRQIGVNRAFKRSLHLKATYGNLEYGAHLHAIFNGFVAVFVFLAYLKIFKYIVINKAMQQLHSTLHKCLLDILGFSIMFFVIFFAYAEVGYLLFGAEVHGFSSFSASMFSLFSAILGDFSYMEIEGNNHILAPVYFLSYTFFVFFVLLNMFLAIINDTYSEVKTEITMASDTDMELSQFITTGVYKFLNSSRLKRWVPDIKDIDGKGRYSATIEDIRTTLEKCGFNEDEIQQFFVRNKIDASSELNEFAISNLMQDLETKSIEKPTKEEKAPVTSHLLSYNDFIAQQARISQVERTLDELDSKIDGLLHQMGVLENIRKGA